MSRWEEQRFCDSQTTASLFRNIFRNSDAHIFPLFGCGSGPDLKTTCYVYASACLFLLLSVSKSCFAFFFMRHFRKGRLMSHRPVLILCSLLTALPRRETQGRQFWSWSKQWETVAFIYNYSITALSAVELMTLPPYYVCLLSFYSLFFFICFVSSNNVDTKHLSASASEPNPMLNVNTQFKRSWTTVLKVNAWWHVIQTSSSGIL